MTFTVLRTCCICVFVGLCWLQGCYGGSLFAVLHTLFVQVWWVPWSVALVALKWPAAFSPWLQGKGPDNGLKRGFA